jgi:uncharacterized protein YyaL (SSP411 family)
VLQDLGHLLDEPRYLDAAERTLKAAAPFVEEEPVLHAAVLCALLDALEPPTVAVVRSDDTARARAFADAARAQRPARVRCYVLPATASGLPGLLDARGALPGAVVTAYVCAGRACSAPATNVADFREALTV